MGFRHLSFTERRRRRLAKKVDRLDRLETRNTITEPISVTGLAISALRGLVQLGIMHPHGGSNALSGLMRPADVARQSGIAGGNPVVIHRNLLKPIPELQPQRGAGGGSSGVPATPAGTAKSTANDASNDWLTFNTAPAATASDASRHLDPVAPGQRRQAAGRPCRRAAGRALRGRPAHRPGGRSRRSGCPHPRRRRAMRAAPRRPCSRPWRARAAQEPRTCTRGWGCRVGCIEGASSWTGELRSGDQLRRAAGPAVPRSAPMRSGGGTALRRLDSRSHHRQLVGTEPELVPVLPHVRPG